MTLKGSLANNAEAIQTPRNAGISAQIKDSRTLNELGIELNTSPSANRGEENLVVKYPLLFDFLFPKISVTKVQSPTIRTIETVRGVNLDGRTTIRWPNCTARNLSFEVTYIGSSLNFGSNMRSELMAGGYAPYARMQIVRSRPERITVRYELNNVPNEQWRPSGALSFWMHDVNDPEKHWAGRAPYIAVVQPSGCTSSADPPPRVGGGIVVRPPSGTGLKPTIPNPIEPSNNASCVGLGAPPFDQTVPFKWEPAENVTADLPYEVQVKQANVNCPNNPTFSEPPRCHLEVARTTETALNLAADTAYAWRVRGSNKDSQRQRIYGDWSNWQNFRTRGPVEAPVTRSSVSNYCFPPASPGSVITGVSVELEWQASPCGNPSYEYRVFRQDRLAPWITGTTSLTQATVTLRLDPPPPPRNDSDDQSSEDQSSEDQSSEDQFSEDQSSEDQSSEDQPSKKPRTVSYSWQVRATVPWGTSDWSPLRSIQLSDCQ